MNDALADIGLFYRNRLGPFEVKGSTGFPIAEVNCGQAPQTSGSFSILHAASGLSASFSGDNRESGGKHLYTKIGLNRHWIDWGDTTALDYLDARSIPSGARWKF